MQQRQASLLKSPTLQFPVIRGKIINNTTTIPTRTFPHMRIYIYIPVTSVDWWLLWLETKSPDPRIGAVRAILEAFQSSLLDRKAANDLLITYLRAKAVVLTAWEKILDCVLTRGIALSSEGRLGGIVDRES